jgi:Lar family restriction alleviation protein
MSGKLKPCPFCGSYDCVADISDFSGNARVTCMHCEAAGPFEKNADKAKEAWNRRIVLAEWDKEAGK